MKKTRFTEEQIAFALWQAETGTRIAEVCRKMVICTFTFCLDVKPARQPQAVFIGAIVKKV